MMFPFDLPDIEKLIYRDYFRAADMIDGYAQTGKKRDPKQRGEYKKAKRRAQNAKMRKHNKRRNK